MLRWVPVVLLAVAGCMSASSGGSAAPIVAPSSDGLPGPPAVPTGDPKTACAASADFYADLTTYTPHAVSLLVADAQRVESLATSAQATDADALVAEVSSSSWPTSGSVDSPAVAKMQADCP